MTDVEWDEWPDTDLTPELQSAVRQLRDGGMRREAALEILLTSDSTTARAKAFDEYCGAHRNTRWGGPEWPFSEQIEQAVHRAAVQELASAADERVRLPSARDTRDNHVTAFYALWFCAGPADAPLVSRALVGLARSNPEALRFGIVVAGSLLSYRLRRSRHNQLIEALKRIAADVEVDPQTRASALVELGDRSRRKEVTLFLAAATGDPDLDISSSAAMALLDRKARFTGRIRKLAANWPTTSTAERGLPFAVGEVRRRLTYGAD